MAPEVLEKEPYDARCDLWSLGVVMFMLLSGRPPFFHDDIFELFELIKEGKFSFSYPIWNDISDEAKDLISKLLVVNPEQRIKKEEILQHPPRFPGRQKQSGQDHSD